MIKRPGQRHYSAEVMILAVSVWMVLFDNYSFFSHLLSTYPITVTNIGFLISLCLLFTAIMVILLAAMGIGRLLKLILIIILMVGSVTAYFMDSYNTIISMEVVKSVLQTDVSESFGLLNVKLALYLGLIGVLPSFLVCRVNIRTLPFRMAFFSRLKLFGASAAVIFSMLLIFSDAYASFFREHKSIRYYTNPTTPIYAAFKYFNGRLVSDGNFTYQKIGLDAHRDIYVGKRKLLILVIGETARADRFSLNGYIKNTNPLLDQRHVVSFDNVWSCGTATSVSVPCMFSSLNQSNYREKVAENTDNVLDVLKRAGVHVVWFDNNSDSKGVALRVPYASYRSSSINPDCDIECRDVGMLVGVKKFVSETPAGDILVVLHQMGSHGPEYAKRYPKEFEHFSPSCQSNLLNECSQDEINNAYDNSILYTDYFLSQIIDYLKSQTSQMSTAMLYISDHGESLGESGIYLHGFPYSFAPDVQKHVPMIFWADSDYIESKKDILDKSSVERRLSHDNLFHTVLGLMAIKTSIYKAEMDIFSDG
ncbi:phosphoethanolamine transferase [Microbulbifer variabilis]|uniref:phosphoethanolamine transferase n=1 Tax=Microbulbifer variabilis TaxID=266805 RepID=UPI001CFE38B6|nr:phosphoethanolamine--lipid A transferase [Microbulbifer variabilis]